LGLVLGGRGLGWDPPSVKFSKGRDLTAIAEKMGETPGMAYLFERMRFSLSPREPEYLS